MVLVESKVSKAQQKIKGILNVFDGVYDHTDNQIWTHSYKQKTGQQQILDFIKGVDQNMISV